LQRVSDAGTRQIGISLGVFFVAGLNCNVEALAPVLRAYESAFGFSPPFSLPLWYYEMVCIQGPGP